jgi:hypothetical protein
MATCGLWPGRLHLTAVVADDDGKAGSALLVARNDDARWELLQHLDVTEGLDYELVVPEGLLVIDPIADLALRHGRTVWIAPWQWVDAIRQVAGLAKGPPRRSAAMIARLPLTPFRAQLRRAAGPDRRQFTMF